MPDFSSNSRALLQLARNSIETYLAAGNYLEFQTAAPEFNLKRGCFITLRKAGHLRGCVGTFDAAAPLAQNLIRMAVAAAFQDPRFPPVTKEELPHLHIELSILGELEKVNSLQEIEIGKHGVYVKYGHRSGTYLPDVAVEQKWSVAEFVTYCAREKARLLPGEITRAEIFRYEVEKIKE